MYTLSIYDSHSGIEASKQYASLNDALQAAILAFPEIDPFEIGLGAIQGRYIGQSRGQYLAVTKIFA